MDSERTKYVLVAETLDHIYAPNALIGRRFDDEKASAAFLHTTFTHRPNNEDSRSSISLQDCFHHYTQTEDSLEYHCSECKKRVQAKKDLKFIKLPTVLVVLLKRFESDLKKITSVNAKSLLEIN